MYVSVFVASSRIPCLVAYLIIRSCILSVASSNPLPMRGQWLDSSSFDPPLLSESSCRYPYLHERLQRTALAEASSRELLRMMGC